MTRKFLSLNGSNWRFAPVAQKPFGDINDLGKARDWLAAQVPGDVRLDLLRVDRISDPFYAANNEDSQWVDSRDWWYTRDVELQLNEGERAFLVLEGIDYQSAVFFDGKPLGRHAGMFSRRIYQLPTKDERRKIRFAPRSSQFGFGVPTRCRNSRGRSRRESGAASSVRCSHRQARRSPTATPR